MKNILAIALLLTILWSCEKSNVRPSAGGGSTDQNTVNLYLNDNIILPPGSFQVSEDSIIIDSSITLFSNRSHFPIVVEGGENLTVKIDYFAPSSDVSYAGIRFGENGPITLIPITNAFGNQIGSLNFSSQIPNDLCSQFGSICHDLKRYEFAVARSVDGTYRASKSNTFHIVAKCGACDSPSCMALLDNPCDTTAGGGGGGSNSSNLTVNGISKAIVFSSCDYDGYNDEFQGFMYKDSIVIAGNYQVVFVAKSYPTASTTYNLTPAYPPSSTTEAFMLYEEFNSTSSSTRYYPLQGATVTLNVNGSDIRWQFNNVILQDPSNNQVTVSGQIICQ